MKNAFPIFHIFLWTKLIMVEVKNYNLNVTEVRYPAFPMPFHGIFNFTVGILHVILTMHYPQFRQWLQKQTRAWKHSTREIELSAEHEESNPFRPLSKKINIL